jgi:predicted esterase
MTSNSHTLEIARTARYYTLGSLNADTRTVWFVCHGYGQLADYFIKKFEVLLDEHTCIVAPEAFNRFYLQGFDGRVGATWMTKEARLDDIKDYVNYLNTLYAHLMSPVVTSSIQINILGFSQGVATVCRWVAAGQVKINKLILWGGLIPPDLQPGLTPAQLQELQLYVVNGNQDPFLKEAKLKMYIPDYTALGLNPRILSFEGGHDLHQETLLQIKQEG